MSKKYSPGPWRWEDWKTTQVEVDDPRVSDAEGGTVVTLPYWANEADGPLLAAAPELLAALKEAIGIIDTSPGCGGCDYAWCTTCVTARLESLIARVEGKGDAG